MADFTLHGIEQSKSIQKTGGDIYNFRDILLVSVTATSVYVFYILYQTGLFHFFSIVFILLLLGIHKGIFKRIAKALKN